MNTDGINRNITNYLFATNDDRHVFRASVGKTLPATLKDEVLKGYFPLGNEGSSKTPIGERDIEIIKVLPTLAQTPYFFKKLNEHTESFCENLIDNTFGTKIETSLAEVGTLKTLEDTGEFFKSIINKHDNNQPITNNEKIVFKHLLTGLLKIDKNLDAENTVAILNLLTENFDPDQSGHKNKLYFCVLRQEFGLKKVIEELWDIKKPEMYSIQNGHRFESCNDNLIESIARLKTLSDIYRHWEFEKVKKYLLNLETLNPEKTYQKSLLELIIEDCHPVLLEILMKRKDFDIHQLKILDETPLIFAMKQEWSPLWGQVIEILIENDTNTLSRRGKTPLQLAIHFFERWSRFTHGSVNSNPFYKIINLLLDSSKLNVDGKDSAGLTALAHMASLPNIDPPCLEFINKLIKRGADLDHPIPNHGTVRTLLQEKLKPEQFAEIEKLAENRS